MSTTSLRAFRPSFPRIALVAASAAIALSALPASAGEVYLQGGFAGAGIGYAQPLNESFGLRADVMSLGRHKGHYTEDNIDYEGTLRLDRVAVFGDWFVTGGGWRLTGGVGAHDAKLDLRAEGTGQLVTIGTRTLTLTASDRFDVTVKYPSVMPYLGLGYGHQRDAAGWGFVFDLGVFIGKAKVSGVATGAGVTAAGITQADVDAELQQVRDSTSASVLPQLTFGANYRF